MAENSNPEMICRSCGFQWKESRKEYTSQSPIGRLFAPAPNNLTVCPVCKSTKIEADAPWRDTEEAQVGEVQPEAPDTKPASKQPKPAVPSQPPIVAWRELHTKPPKVSTNPTPEEPKQPVPSQPLYTKPNFGIEPSDHEVVKAAKVVFGVSLGLWVWVLCLGPFIALGIWILSRVGS